MTKQKNHAIKTAQKNKRAESGVLLFFTILFCTIMFVGLFIYVSSSTTKANYKAKSDIDYSIKSNFVITLLESRITEDGYNGIELADMIALYNADTSPNTGSGANAGSGTNPANDPVLRQALEKEIKRIMYAGFADRCWLFTIEPMAAPQSSILFQPNKGECNNPEGYVSKSYSQQFKTIDNKLVRVIVNV